jgi:glutaminyl-tRNA synthetase
MSTPTSRPPTPPRNPDGTAEATKQNIESKPHPSKNSNPAAAVNVSGDREGLDFIRRIIEEDNRTGKWGGRIATRFPPEPNGYLHIGHAKSICLNFGIADEYGGICNLRYDDTNPAKEEEEYVRSIEEDVRWLGFTPAETLWASDYFGTMHEYAVELIKKGKAYVCDLTAEQVSEFRGPPTRPGRESPYRNRGVEENLDLFERMRKGEFPDGSRTLRGKIDMASPNLNLRDPVMYRIPARDAPQHRG